MLDPDPDLYSKTDPCWTMWLVLGAKLKLVLNIKDICMFLRVWYGSRTNSTFQLVPEAKIEHLFVLCLWHHEHQAISLALNTLRICDRKRSEKMLSICQDISIGSTPGWSDRGQVMVVDSRSTKTPSSFKYSDLERNVEDDYFRLNSWPLNWLLMRMLLRFKLGGIIYHPCCCSDSFVSYWK